MLRAKFGLIFFFLLDEVGRQSATEHSKPKELKYSSLEIHFSLYDSNQLDFKAPSLIAHIGLEVMYAVFLDRRWNNHVGVIAIGIFA